MKQANLFQLFFETINEPILILQGTEIVAGNAPARALLQSETDLSGQSLLQWVTETEQLPAQIATVLNDKPQNYLWQLQRSDGSLFPIQTTLSRLSNASTSWIKAQFTPPTPKDENTTSLTLIHKIVNTLYNTHHFDKITPQTGLLDLSKALSTDSPEVFTLALHHLQKSSQSTHLALYENVETSNDGLQAQLVTDIWDNERPEPERISWGQTLSYNQEWPHWEKELAAGKIVAGTPSNSPTKEQAFLQRFNIPSILLIPIRIADNWYGFLGLESKNKAIEWQKTHIQILQTATELIAHYLGQKQTITALVTSEQRFRKLTENSPDTVFILDLQQMKALYINRDSFLGYTQHELASPNFFHNTHPDDLEGLRQHWNRVIDGIQETFEYRVQSKTGEWEWVQNREVPLEFDANGRPNQLLITLTLVTNRKKLEIQIQEASQRRSQQIELTTRIAQEIASATQLDTLYQRIVDRVKETFGYTHAQLFRYDPIREVMGLVVGYGEIGQRMLAVRHALPMGRGLVGTAAATGQSFLRPNITGDPDWVPNRFLPNTKGELAVPIKLGERVLGVLDVQSNIADQLSLEDQLLLEGLCGQIAIAIESTRLSESLAEQLRELSNLQRLMTREGWRSRQTAKRLKGVIFDSSQGEVREADLPALWNQPVTTHQPPNAIVPIAVRGQVIGSLGILDDPNQPLPMEDQELLETISTQIAEALETARLLEQTQKRAVELEAVAQVGTAATTILDTNKLLQSVVSYTQASFQLYQVAILLFDPTTKQLTSWAVAGTERTGFAANPLDPTLSLETISLSQEPSVVAKAARTRQGVLIADSLTDPDFLPYHLSPHTRSEIAVPMLAGNELVGVLDLQADIPNYFTTEDVRTYATLASQVAVALQNARLYQEQLETAEKLREVERLKSQFLANMSHELRTPLNSIIGFSDVLLDGLEGPMSPRMEEDVRMIRTSGQYLRELIGDILDMSKIEAGMMELRKEKVYVPYVVSEIVALQQPLAENKGLELKVNVPLDLPYLHADPTRLRQILINLVSNGIKFTDSGHVTIQITNYPHEMHFSVQDSGIGLHPQDIPIIFQEFRQVDESLVRRVGGTGLGLPISKHLVELHGGQIGVESSPNSGSNFWFTIPY